MTDVVMAELSLDEPTGALPESNTPTVIAASLGGVAAALLILAIARSSGFGREQGPKYSIHANEAYNPEFADSADADSTAA